MTTTAIETPGNEQIKESAAALQELRSRIAGRLISAIDDGYEEARQTHDVSLDRRPLALVRAAMSQDVAEGVRFARRHGHPLAVRGGGHSLAGHSMIDDAIVIDLSGMRGVSVDPERRVARVQAGSTSGDLAGPAQEHGLALSTGDTSTVGLGGLVTGGGIGWMARRFGLTIDHLRSAQVVTAQGEIVEASPSQHPDLFWAIRGGGGNVGIVTEFELGLDEVGEILGGAIVLPATAEVVRGYLDYVSTAPEDLTTIAQLMPAPPAPFIPADQVGTPVFLLMVCWTGDLEEGQRVLAPLRALGPIVADVVGPMPYPAIYQLTEVPAMRHSASVRSLFTDEIDDEAVAKMVASLDRPAGPLSMVQLRGLGGAIAAVDDSETAYAHRQRRYLVLLISAWFDAAESPTPHAAWVEALWSQIERLGHGAYVNFVSDEGEARIRDAYPEATHRRLAEVKRRWDPDNLFRFNQNVRPSA